MLSEKDLQHFDKHFIYTLSHILLGFIAVWYPTLGLLFIAYQLLQYFLQIRFFLFSFEIKHGNSLYHTIRKISEIAVGYFIGLLVAAVI
jgi:hypothetical protein